MGNKKKRRRQIYNPAKVSYRLYVFLIGGSILLMVFGFICLEGIFSDIIKNLSYGLLSSSIGALLIEFSNVRDKNRKSNQIYDLVYTDLKKRIAWYLFNWASEYSLFYYKDESGVEIEFKENLTWWEWHRLFIEKITVLKDIHLQETVLIDTLEDQIRNIKDVEEAIHKIEMQNSVLMFNGIADDTLNDVILCTGRYFNQARRSVECAYQKVMRHSKNENKKAQHIKEAIEEFSQGMDILQNNLKICISRWIDIAHYNDIKFRDNYLVFLDFEDLFL